MILISGAGGLVIVHSVLYADVYCLLATDLWFRLRFAEP